VEHLTGNMLLAPLLRPEEKCFVLMRVIKPWDEDGSAQRVAVVILLVSRTGGLEKSTRVQVVIAEEFEQVATEFLCA
jgi:hypothetical protein